MKPQTHQNPSCDTEMRFLAGDVSRTQLIQAAAANHTEWFAANARASGGEVYETNGVRWTATAREVVIAFPCLESETAGATLDAIVAKCFRRKMTTSSCWSLSPTRPLGWARHFGRTEMLALLEQSQAKRLTL